jgi:hypothetical protein
MTQAELDIWTVEIKKLIDQSYLSHAQKASLTGAFALITIAPIVEEP